MLRRLKQIKVISDWIKPYICKLTKINKYLQLLNDHPQIIFV